MLRRVLFFTAMKRKPFRKPRISTFGDVSRLTRQEPKGDIIVKGTDAQGQTSYEAM